MKLGKIFVLVAAVALGGLTGCGDVCEDAAEICGAGDADSGDAECTGDAECAANCIVDADSCDLTDTALVECISGCV